MMKMTEAQRTKLIGELVTVLRNVRVPNEARQAGLTLIGWLARRMPHDAIPMQVPARVRKR